MTPVSESKLGQKQHIQSKVRPVVVTMLTHVTVAEQEAAIPVGADCPESNWH